MASDSGNRQAGTFFYGWIIVATLFVMLAFTSGLGFYNHAVILRALIAERDFSPAVASSAISVFFMTSGLAGLWVAHLLERQDVRFSIAAGGLCAGLSLALVGHVNSVWQLYLLYTFFGIGFCASSMLPATTLIARWFGKKRAFALSIASTGLSVGGILITPMSAVLVKQVGLTQAGYWFGLCYTLGVLPLTWLTLRSRPSDMGLEPDGGPLNTQASAVDGVSFYRAMREHFFWGLSIAYLFVMLAQVGAIAHQYGLISERLAPGKEALALSILPLFSIFGRLAGGYFMDNLSMRAFTLIMMSLQATSLAVMGLFTHEWVLMAGLAVFGLSVGNLLMLQPLMITRVYGLLHYSRIFSVSNLLTTFGVALGPGLMGLVYARTENYEWPFVVAALSGFLAASLFLLFSRRLR